MTRWFCPAALLFLLASFATQATAGEDPFDVQMMRATVKISHEKSTATGFILTGGDPERSLLVTAAHVFDNTPGDATTIVFRNRQAEGEYSKEPTPLAIRQEGKPLWVKHPTEDVAAIWVVPPKTADLQRISTDLLATDAELLAAEVHPGDRIASLGYPHGEEGSSAGFPLLRTGAIASFPLLPSAKIKTFYISSNVFEGDSGGPVYLTLTDRKHQAADRAGLIVGIVVGQRFLDEEAKMIYGTTKFRHRLGLAVVVHAALIKETIALLK